MAEEIRTEQEKASQAGKTPAKKRSLVRRIAVFALRGMGLLLLSLFVAAAVGGYWLCATDSGHKFLLDAGNRLLGGEKPDGGMRVRLTGLEGTLPFSFRIGFDLLDDDGVFLRAPDNSLSLAWRDLPGRINLQSLKSENPALLRLPRLPQAPPSQEKEKPFSIEDFRRLLSLAAEYLAAPPAWLPSVAVQSAAVVNASIPQSLLGAAPAPDAEKEDANDALRADVELNLDWSRQELAAGAQARLAAAAGETARLPGMEFSAADVELRLHAPARKEALELAAALKAEMEEPRIEARGIPADLAGEKITLALDARLDASCPAYKPAEEIALNLTGPALAAGRIHAAGEASWRSGPALAQNRLDGPLSLNLDLTLADSEASGADSARAASDGKADVETASDILAMLRAPLSLAIRGAGDILKPDLSVSLACEDIEAQGHALKNLALELSGRNLAIPATGGMLSEDENRIELTLSGSLDGHKLACETGIFYKPEKSGDGGDEFTAGLRNLNLLAAGVEGKGSAAARIRPAQKPALDGSLSFRVADWAALAALAPGSEMGGDARIDLYLASEKEGQKAVAEIAVPRFFMNRDKKRLAALKGLVAKCVLDDAFVKPLLDASLHLDEIQAAGMRLNAKAGAKGPLDGPLAVNLESGGGVASRLSLVWSPGKAEISALDVKYSLPGKGGAKGATLGARAARPMRVSYGEGGLGFENVDLAILPAGRLRAEGGLAPHKLDLDFKLENLLFKPWRALAPQLPEGSAEVSAKLDGAPQRPSGNFRLGLVGIKVPNVPLAPATLALAGRITPQGGSRGDLEAALEVPKDTLRALGAADCEVRIRAPLLFGDDGIPKPDMGAPFSGRIVWTGALGPLWNLVPLADMRLNGKIGVNIDAGGTLGAPRVKGGVTISDGRYENVALGVLLTQIGLKLDLDGAGAPVKGKLPGSMRLALNASDGRGGLIDVKGGGDLDGAGLAINAEIRKLRPLRRRDVHVELSGAAKVTGSAFAPAIDGKITVDKGEILLDNIDMGASSITTLPITTPAMEKAAAAKAAKSAGKPASQDGSGRLNVRIVMPPRFSVEGRGLTSLWQANLLISGPLNNPAVTGTVNCYRGNFDFLGKNFQLTRGEVLFAGGSLSNPLLDIELTNETPDLTAHLFITGPVSKMKLSLTSDPSLPRDDILSKVLFGRSSNELSRLEALQLAGAVAQLAGFTGNGSSIFQMGKKALGLDVLRLGSSSTAKAGEPGETTASGTTLEAGKYINDWLYTGVQQGMKADSTAFIIELQLTPRSNLEIHTEQSNTWAGYKWKLNY